MRSTRPFAALAVGLALMSTTAVQAQADLHAQDGQTFVSQPAATQDLFQSVWGANATSRWIQEHNTALGLLPRTAELAPVAPVFINMNDHDQFVPAGLKVAQGTSVTWHNSDTDAHTVTGDPARSFPGVSIVEPAGARPWDSGLVAPNQNFTVSFDVPGHYIYICTVHAGSGMVGTIDVG